MASLLFYILIFIIIFILNSIGSQFYVKKKPIGKILIFLGFLTLLLIQGLRYNVGTDYKSYLEYYNIIKSTSLRNLFSLSWEWGALITFKFSSILFNNPKIIFSIIGLFILYPIYKINKMYDYKYLNYSILTFCFMYLPFCLNGMRQGIAMGFGLLCFMYLIESKKVKASISFLIGALFHRTILLLLPYLIIYYIFKSQKYKKYSFILTCAMSVIILFLLKDFLVSKNILSYTYYLNDININNLSLQVIIFYVPIILLIIFYSKKTIISETLCGLVISGIIFNVIGTSAHYLTRIALYFNYFQIILMPHIIENIKNKDTRIIVKVLYLAYLIIYFIIEFYINGKHEIIPYQIAF